MSDRRAKHADARMRFFTPEMYLRLNSANGAVAERAAKDWEAALTRYGEHIDRIRATMPASVRQLSTLSLHDWELTQNPVEPDPAVQGLTAVDVPFWLKFTAVGLRKAQEVIVLFYLLWDDVRTRAPHPRWCRQQSPNGQPYWLYDEIDRDPSTTDKYVHRVFFSDGTVREIPFTSCYVYRFSAEGLRGVPTRAGSRRKKSA
jgi:hypothetical protein